MGHRPTPERIAFLRANREKGNPAMFGDRNDLLSEVDALTAERDRLAAQIDKLANHILEHVPGEPSVNEGAVDCSIRVMDRLAAELAELRGVHRALSEHADWLSQQRREEIDRCEQLKAKLAIAEPVAKAAREYQAALSSPECYDVASSHLALVDLCRAQAGGGK